MEMEYHNPVLLHETVDGLNIKPNGVYVDVTFGGGGHSKEILNRLGPHGKLFAFDQDEDALNVFKKTDIQEVLQQLNAIFQPINIYYQHAPALLAKNVSMMRLST